MMIIFGLLGVLLIVSVLYMCRAAGDADRDREMERELREIDWEELKKYMMMTTEDEE